MPDCTSSQRQVSVPSAAPAGAGLPTGASHSARATPAPGYRRSTCASPWRSCCQGGAGSSVGTVAPHRPCSANSSLASLSLALARNTNICRRLRVAGSSSRSSTSSTSSWLRLQPTKLASSRPLGEQKPASRASDRPSSEKSWVSWPCKNLAASSPRAAITPKWGRGHTPSKAWGAEVSVMG